MAETEYEVTFTWNNGVQFKMETQLTGEAKKIIIRTEENSCLADVWSHIQAICEDCITHQLDIIGEEMKAE